LKEKIVKFISTGFFVGYIPYAPGTFGTFVGIPILYILKKLPLTLSIAFIIIFSVFSIFISDSARKIYKSKDPRCVVIDEIAGYLCAGIFFPFTWKFVSLSFILFRFFDILKPYPVKKSELLNGGCGIVLDDVVSGLFSAISLFIIRVFLKF
jgi:phosphatidylglycerophosphatase A